jgi:competence protein ComEA
MDAAPPSAPPQPAPATPTWPRAAQLAAALLLGGALALLGVHAWGYVGWVSRPTELRPSRVTALDLNSAGRAELIQLPGVGPSLAGRIEDYRREHGRFRSAEELRQVHGVGPATLARLRPFVYVEGAEDDEPDVETLTTTDRPASPAKATGPKAAGLSKPIDVNKASAADLRKLPGVGPKMSQAIVDERERAPFKSVDDLRRVHGIGAKTLDRLRPYVTVGREAVRVASNE